MDEQEITVTFKNEIPYFNDPLNHISFQDCQDWRFFSDLRTGMLVEYAVVEKKSLIAQPFIDLTMNYIKKNFDSFTKE